MSKHTAKGYLYSARWPLAYRVPDAQRSKQVPVCVTRTNNICLTASKTLLFVAMLDSNLKDALFKVSSRGTQQLII